jgi:glc operon protein GlcG
MKTVGLSLLSAAAFVVLCMPGFPQTKPDQIEAGTSQKALPKAQVRPMTVELAKQLVAAAKKATCMPPAGSCAGAFAVADDAGVILYLEVIDGVLAGGPDLAIRKAKTSALWRRPTTLFQDAVNNKTNTSYADGTFTDMTTSPGGVPIVKDGRMVGGVGIAAVGQGTKQIDDAIIAEATKIFGPQ